jgi:hypothetical protein
MLAVERFVQYEACMSMSRKQPFVRWPFFVVLLAVVAIAIPLLKRETPLQRAIRLKNQEAGKVTREARAKPKAP